MGKRLFQLNQVDNIAKEDYLLVDGEQYLESKKIKIKNIDIEKFDTQNFYTKIDGNFVKKESNKGLSTNDFTNDDKDKLDNSQKRLESGVNIKTINGQSVLGQGNIEIEGGSGDHDFVVDQEYNPESENAQSGKAIAPVLQGKIAIWQSTTEYKVGDVVIENFANGYDGNPRTGVLRCVKNHTSSNYFNLDYLSESKWEQMKDVWAEYAYRDYLGNLIPRTYATKEELTQSIGDIETALEELHNYAQALIEGGSE